MFNNYRINYLRKQDHIRISSNELIILEKELDFLLIWREVEIIIWGNQFNDWKLYVVFKSFPIFISYAYITSYNI